MAAFAGGQVLLDVGERQRALGVLEQQLGGMAVNGYSSLRIRERARCRRL